MGFFLPLVMRVAPLGNTTGTDATVLLEIIYTSVACGTSILSANGRKFIINTYTYDRIRGFELRRELMASRISFLKLR